MLGAVSFSLDERLVAALQADLPLRTFVETGTYKGDTLARMLPHFDLLHSVELSQPLWADASQRFADAPQVVISNADSPAFLAGLKTALADQPTLYWLDAHWCGVENVAGESSQCPLLAELRAIGSLPELSVILIDDARLFLAPPAAPHEISQWPRFHAIVRALLSLSSQHELMVVNDVIAFFPSVVRPRMEAYAQASGVDWIAAADRVRDLIENERALVIKESTIQDMARSLTEKEEMIQSMGQSLLEKEGVIKELASVDWVAATQRLQSLLDNDGALAEKEAVIQEMARSLVEKEAMIQTLAQSLRDKEQVIHGLVSAH